MLSLTPSPVSLYCINHAATPTYHKTITRALTTDFPIFKQRCKFSPHTVCNHPEKNCKRARLSLQGYARYYTTGYKFIPLPANPFPIFKLLCDGCALPQSQCDEGCFAYCEELWAYTVYQWDADGGRFDEVEILSKDLDPLKHGFFSYKVYKDEIRETRKKLKRKRSPNESVEEGQPKRKKTHPESPSCHPTPTSNHSPSPELL